jgi:hypothetical protein
MPLTIEPNTLDNLAPIDELAMASTVEMDN